MNSNQLTGTQTWAKPFLRSHMHSRGRPVTRGGIKGHLRMPSHPRFHPTLKPVSTRGPVGRAPNLPDFPCSGLLVFYPVFGQPSPFFPGT